MKKPVDTTLAVLKEIRGELQTLRVEMRTELHELRGDLAATNQRIVESEIRTATALTDLAGTVREMTGVLRSQHDLRPRLERCEHDIADLKARLPHAS